MKTVYLVRHGETKSNSMRIVQGMSDELSELGHKQAVELAGRLKKLKFQHLLVSDYTRAKQTVSPLLELVDIKPEYTALVREARQPTSFQGKSNQSEEFLSYYRKVEENIHDPDWHFEDEENFFDVLERVKHLFEIIREKEGDVLIVTHGRFIIYTVMYVLSGGNLDSNIWKQCRHGFHTYNTGITTLKFFDEYEAWKVLSFNDIAHFAD